MAATRRENTLLILDILLNPIGSMPSTRGFHLGGEAASQSESQPPEVTGNWQKRENTEHSDAEEDIRLHELMEDIKRYIRNIDVSNL